MNRATGGWYGRPGRCSLARASATMEGMSGGGGRRNWSEALDQLANRIPPPDRPVRADGDWEVFASRNGFEPPSDYRALIGRYGAGAFGGWLRLIEPFDPATSFVIASEWRRDLI